ncbi:MAG: hybrid sensor histidine kinase/response regulator [Magnetococcales bacterium]|nr:hybrid sensor histidine kinase/response regulator [Magnetococcales bacterium]
MKHSHAPKDGTILLVDDQPDQIKVIKAALDDHYLVKVAIRGEVACQIAAGGGIDLILLDILMPGMDGYEVCRRLKADPATAGIPVLFLTCKDTQDDESVGLRLGAVDFIRKPSSAAVVLLRCRNTIAFIRAREDLERKNAQLQEALRVREEMERIARHDLKAPLSAILSLPELLLLKGQFTPEQVNFLQMIERSGYVMLEMINKSLDLFRMENDTYPFQPEPFDLLETLKHIVADCTRHSHVVKARIVMAEGERFPVLGEKWLSYPLFYNLVLNAIEAVDSAGEVLIELSSDEAFGKIRISNPGEVPPEIRDRFFEKYVTSGKPKGTGLGTYSAWLAARTQNGRIELDASVPGRTSILVSLPRPREGEASS